MAVVLLSLSAVSLGTVRKGWQWLVQYELAPLAVSACHL